ncbi:MAG: hypothetical protein JO036_11435 [Candidatus Eremiobacteraeota bacterium]|nr:hypothetical protein [Candidatus Eremiobacteraeota bacterium]
MGRFDRGNAVGIDWYAMFALRLYDSVSATIAYQEAFDESSVDEHNTLPAADKTFQVHRF